MPALSLQLSQKLSLNSRIITSLNVLQLSQSQLSEAVNEALASNPLLQIDSSDTSPSDNVTSKAATQEWSQDLSSASSEDYIDRIDAHEQSLHDFLRWQNDISQHSAAQKALIEILIDALTDEGYLRQPLEQLAEAHQSSLAAFDKALSGLQNFEPSGIGARDLQECLTIQLRHEFSHHAQQPFAIKMLNHLDWLADIDAHEAQLMAALACDKHDLRAAQGLIQQLSPRPGLSVSADRQNHIRPDIVISRLPDESLELQVANQPPALKINQQLVALASQDNSPETKQWTQNLKTQATDLIHAIEYRRSTMERVGEYLLAHQEDYFRDGLAHLKPCLLSDIAETLGLNISTLSRAANNKYIQSPQGTELLRQLFSTALPSQPTITNRYAKSCLQQIIDNEPLQEPLSDDAICDALKEQGLSLSRRTVTKYRLSLNIPNSRQRKLR